jgi:signal transduction histidine kinase
MRLRFLSAVATQASVALENARLYARVESFNKELEANVDERTRELNDAYRKLQMLDLMKDDFLASMSHELLTPLTSISGFAEILVATAKEQGPAAVAERAEFGSIVQKEAERLTDMLQRVLDLSMLESGSVSLEPRPMDLREHLLESFKRFRDGFRSKDLKVRLRVAEGMPPAQGDPRWLRHVFEALLSNAVKFSPEENEVSITINTVGDEAVVLVEDRGPGVSPSVRGSIFEKFKQLGDVLNDKTPGLGLGLPMARMILERLGGRIWYDDGPETGSIFAFALPIAAVAVPEQATR